MINLLIILHSCLTGLNLVNSRLDAYLIFKSKTVAHWVNGLVFFIFTSAEIICGWLHGWKWWFCLLYLVTSCLNRRVVFGISLNLRRRIKDITITWDYISRAEVPAAWLDRKEIELFGRNGRKIHVVYIAAWIIFSGATFVLINKN